MEVENPNDTTTGTTEKQKKSSQVPEHLVSSSLQKKIRSRAELILYRVFQ
jgi:hypothetical protein